MPKDELTRLMKAIPMSRKMKRSGPTECAAGAVGHYNIQFRDVSYFGILDRKLDHAKV